MRKRNKAKSKDRISDCDKGQTSVAYRRIGMHLLSTILLTYLLACELLGFSIEGPSQAKIDCHDNGDGSANITYFPFAPGEYAVHVLCDDEDIQHSPWMATIVPASDQFDPSKVRPSALHHNRQHSGVTVSDSCYI